MITQETEKLSSESEQSLKATVNIETIVPYCEREDWDVNNGNGSE